MARYTLVHGDCGMYELFLASKRLAAQYERETGHESVLFTDWDYPGLAQSLGWNMRGRKCEHRSTDGTVDCRECGKTAHEFIVEAAEWLDKHCDRSFNNDELGVYFGW